MSQRCEQCRNKIRGGHRISPTGRILCSRCSDRFVARAAGLGSGGVAGARSVEGWFERAKKAMRPGRRD
ncbi:MAG: hypothetical protein Q4G40_08250 [Brachybacterium sp.]|nr:hypothetical protein [Brachybacterium sp.]